MAEYEITADLSQVDFGASGITEILQNVKMILATPEFSCPLDRSFAWNPDALDAPMSIAQARLTARLVAAIGKYEPRAKVTSLTYQGDGLTGVLKPVVRVVIEDDTV